ncbi:MAG: hypothetical protein SNG97_06890 [Rikenellaceae bacterium]
MFTSKELDIIALRKDAEINGLFQTKRGITTFYTVHLGMDIEDAEPKIRKECECRDIQFITPDKELPKGTIEKIEGIIKTVGTMSEKYPVVKETVIPFASQVLIGGVAALAGVFTGAKVSEQAQATDAPSLDELEEVELKK